MHDEDILRQCISWWFFYTLFFLMCVACLFPSSFVCLSFSGLMSGWRRVTVGGNTRQGKALFKSQIAVSTPLSRKGRTLWYSIVTSCLLCFSILVVLFSMANIQTSIHPSVRLVCIINSMCQSMLIQNSFGAWEEGVVLMIVVWKAPLTILLIVVTATRVLFYFHGVPW